MTTRDHLASADATAPRAAAAHLTSPYIHADIAAEVLLERAGVDQIDVVVILGSGWKEAALGLGTIDRELRTADLPYFPQPTVPGHEGHVYLTTVAGRTVALLSGRVHLYEGHDAHAVAHAVRTCVRAGARQVVLTNAAGSVDPTILPGTVVAIADHLNLTGTSPLEGPPPPDGYGHRFVDLSDLYSARLRAVVRAQGLGIPEGVYACARGPQYETRAEVTMVGRAGATLVGMSTVLEAIAAHQLSAEVLGLSLVTNLAAGVAPSRLDHADVLDIGIESAPRLTEVLAAVLPHLSGPVAPVGE